MINFGEESKTIKELIQIIIDTYSYDLSKIEREFNLRKFKSKHIFARDIYNEKIDDLLNKKGYIIEDFNRGGHTFVVIYDKKTKTLFSLMNEKTYKSINISKDPFKIHYLEALGIINNDDTPIQEQVTFFKDEEKLHNAKILLNKIVKNKIEVDILNHCLITFKFKDNELKVVNGIQFNSNFDIIQFENLNRYIEVEYNYIGSSQLDIEPEEEIIDESTISLKLFDRKEE